MDTNETTRVLNEFAASFAGSSCEELSKHETDGVIRRITAASGNEYELFLAVDMVEVVDSESPDSKWICRVCVSATPIVRGKPARRSLSGSKDIMPGEIWTGAIGEICVSEIPSMIGCYITLVIVGVALFGLAYWLQSCRLAS